MSVKLEDVLTDRQILDVDNQTPGFCETVRACIRLAVEKAEKVEGFVTVTRADGLLHDGHQSGWFETKVGTVDRNWRHALLLLGPRYEPKPVKTAEERIKEALAYHEKDFHDGKVCTYGGHLGSCHMARILRGEETHK